MEKPDVPLNHSGIREQTEGTTYEPIHADGHHILRDNESISTISDSTADASPTSYEKREGPSHGVNVHRAEAEFAGMSQHTYWDV